MKFITKQFYSDVLKEEDEVCFWTGGLFFSISRHSESGWNVDVYTNNDGCFLSDDEHKLTLVDGGHCTSDKALDAIEFMLGIVD